MDERIDRQTESRHLLRRVKTSLELAIVASAPAEIRDRLGRVSGLLDAVLELADTPPADALIPELLADGHSAVERWEIWEKARAPKA
jgi:hypothetical protein